MDTPEMRAGTTCFLGMNTHMVQWLSEEFGFSLMDADPPKPGGDRGLVPD